MSGTTEEGRTKTEIPPGRTPSHSRRKADHLRITLGEDVQSKALTTGLEKYSFVHQALPEVDLNEIDLSLTLFGKRLKSPLIISSMTGGTPLARRINRNLASAAQATGIAMGVGSQRAALENPASARTYQVRSVAPDILLFANLGAVQLNYGYSLAHCQRAVEMIEADALILHLNPLQEALQVGGNTNFAGLLRKIESICRSLPVPVIVKEVGWGISEEVARKLAEAGVAGIDVSGAGGTSWSEIEKLRLPTATQKRVAEAFASWGIPTAEAIQQARRGAPRTTLLASGGIRTGVDVAKALALGADCAAVAAPFLKAADLSDQAVIEAIEEIVRELKITLFCLGATRLEEIKNSPLLKRIP